MNEPIDKKPIRPSCRAIRPLEVPRAGVRHRLGGPIGALGDFVAPHYPLHEGPPQGGLQGPRGTQYPSGVEGREEVKIGLWPYKFREGPYSLHFGETIIINFIG